MRVGDIDFVTVNVANKYVKHRQNYYCPIPISLGFQWNPTVIRSKAFEKTRKILEYRLCLKRAREAQDF
jgi:hypothetical protein